MSAIRRQSDFHACARPRAADGRPVSLAVCALVLSGVALAQSEQQPEQSHRLAARVIGQDGRQVPAEITARESARRLLVKARRASRSISWIRPTAWA